MSKLRTLSALEWLDTTQDSITMAGLFPGIQPQSGATGNEMIAADTTLGAASGLQPQTVLMPAAMIAGAAPANFRNLIDGGDFSINPWQRGTSFNSIGSATTYTADRWFAFSAVSNVQVNQVANTSIAGFNNALKFSRTTSATSTTNNFIGQILETNDSLRCQGQTVVLSFWAANAGSFTPANSALNVQIIMGTGTNQSSQSAIASTWSGQQSLPLSVPSTALSNVGGGAAGNPSGISFGTVLTGNSAAVVTSAFQRFVFTTNVPTSATQLGVLFSFSGVGTTTTSNDGVLLHGVQLEIGSANAPFPTPFEHRDQQVELEICQRYAWVISEPATGVVVGQGMIGGTNKANIAIPTPVQMRTAPSVAVTAGSWVFNAGGTSATYTGLAAASAHTVNMLQLTASGTAASGFGVFMQGGNGSGTITANADF